jgi:hypothetical protein
MIGLSVAAERVTETIKQWASGPLAKLSSPKQSAAVQFIAIISSMFVVGLSHADPLGIATHCTGWLRCRQGWECLLFTGILASGGSAFWNHLLDILKATKVNAEQTTDTKLAAIGQAAIVG